MLTKIKNCLKCSYCNDILSDEIYNCGTVHCFCKKCVKMFRFCHICKKFITSTRNLAMEAVVKQLLEAINDLRPSANSTTVEESGAPAKVAIEFSLKVFYTGSKINITVGDGKGGAKTEIPLSELDANGKEVKTVLTQEKDDTFAEFSLITHSLDNTSSKPNEKIGKSTSVNINVTPPKNMIVDENIRPRGRRSNNRILKVMATCFNDQNSPISSTRIESDTREPFRDLSHNERNNFLQCPIIKCQKKLANFMSLKGHLNYLHANSLLTLSGLEQHVTINLDAPVVRQIVKFSNVFFVVDCCHFVRKWYLNVGIIVDCKSSDKCFKFRVNHMRINESLVVVPYPQQEKIHKGVSLATGEKSKVTVHFSN